MTLPDLPKLILVADGFCEPGTGARVLELISSGSISWIQLRDHGVSSDVFEETATGMVEGIRTIRPGARRPRISLNGHVDLARMLGVGVHVGLRGPPPGEARAILGPTGLVGYSAHSVSDLTETTISSVDYFTVSPIYAPISKPDVRAGGLELLTRFAEACPRPVFALGGITPDRVSECRQNGAYGVAVVGGIMQVRDPAIAARTYLKELRTTHRTPRT